MAQQRKHNNVRIVFYGFVWQFVVCNVHPLINEFVNM